MIVRGNRDFVTVAYTNRQKACSTFRVTHKLGEFVHP